MSLYDWEGHKKRLLLDYPAHYKEVNEIALIQSIGQLTKNLAYFFGSPFRSVKEYGNALRNMTNASIPTKAFINTWKEMCQEFDAKETCDLRKNFFEIRINAQRDFRRMFDKDLGYYQEHFPTLNHEEITALSEAMQEILLAHTQELCAMLKTVESQECQPEENEFAQQFKLAMQAVSQQNKPVKRVTWAADLRRLRKHQIALVKLLQALNYDEQFAIS